MRKTWLIRALSVLVVWGLLLSAFPTPISAYDSWSTWKSRVDTMIADMDNATYHYGYTDTPRSELLAWNGAYTVNGLLRMYQLTKDSAYIEKASTYINNMYSNLGDVNGDGYLGWGSTHYAPTYTEYIVHYGMVITEWARFILLVRADPTLGAALNPQGVTYSSQTNTLESVIHDHLIARWNKNWSFAYGTYLDEYNAMKSYPHNMYLAMSNALYMMVKVNPDYRRYLLWADQMSGKWKSYTVANGSALKWNYHDRIVPADTHSLRAEDWSHAAMEINNALHNYNRGGSWTAPEVTKLGHTIYSVMHNGSSTNPMLYYHVDGTGAATGEITGSHYDLERWVSGIWERGEKHKSLTWTGVGSRAVMDGTRILQLHPANGAPQSFSLSAPANSATGQPTTQVFSWQPSANASDYTLQVSTSSTFTSYTVNRPNLHDTNAVVQFLNNNTTYYWRVIARNKAGSTVTSAVRSFTTKPAPTFTLSFKHYDSRNSSAPAGFLFKQVLVNNTVVWEQDVTADAANTWLSTSLNITSHVAGLSNAEIKFRVYVKGAIGNYAVDVHFDDVQLTNADVVNGGFEKSEMWSFTRSGSGFSGSYNSAVKDEGARSYKLALPSSTAASVGHFGAVHNRWALAQ